MPAITSINVANAIVKLVASRALPALQGNFVLGSLINRDYDNTFANGGDTLSIPIPPTLVANNIAEGGSVQLQNPSLGTAQIVLNNHIETTFQIPDVMKALTSINLVDTYAVPAGIAVATALETQLANLYPLFTANVPVGSATPMDEARIDAAETTLFSALVPKSEMRYLLVSAGSYSQLRQLPRFTEYQTVGPNVGDSPMMTGKLPGSTNAPNGSADGKIKDFWVYRSQFVPVISGTSYNMAFTKNAVGMAIRRLGTPLPGTGAVAEYMEVGGFGIRMTMSYQPNQLGQQFTLDVLSGMGVVRNAFGVVVKGNS